MNYPAYTTSTATANSDYTLTLYPADKTPYWPKRWSRKKRKIATANWMNVKANFEGFYVYADGGNYTAICADIPSRYPLGFKL